MIVWFFVIVCIVISLDVSVIVGFSLVFVILDDSLDGDVLYRMIFGCI